MTHSQVISRTLYPGRTVVLRGNRALRQDALRAHLPGWLVSPLRWAALPLSSASCSTWPTTSRWAVRSGNGSLQWSWLKQCLNNHSRAAMRLTCPSRHRRQASMLLVFHDFPMRETARCVSSAREPCLDYVWPVDVHMLFVWENSLA